MSGKMRRSEDLDLLLSASDTLLHRVHLACGGYPKDSKCKMFVDTYHEVRRTLSLRELRNRYSMYHSSLMKIQFEGILSLTI